MGELRSTYGERRGYTGFWLGSLRGRHLFGDPGIHWRRIILKCIFEMGCGIVDWIELAQDRDRWRTLVSAVMNLRVP